MKFEFLDHPSDLLIKTSGKTAEEVFSNMMEAVASYLGGESIVSLEVENKPYSINIKGDSFLNLLIRYLNEILFLTETEGKIFTKAEFEELSENSLKAKVYGVASDFIEQIKSATYQSSFKKINGGFEAKVLFDI